MRADCQSRVVSYIRSLDVPNGWKRAAYLQWLLQTGTPYLPADLDQVIPARRPTYPPVEERHACRRQISSN
jgi:hypothetical protein